MSLTATATVHIGARLLQPSRSDRPVIGLTDERIERRPVVLDGNAVVDLPVFLRTVPPVVGVTQQNQTSRQAKGNKSEGILTQSTNEGNF
jgi:hypothetical protein